jgi:hypothetical protein
MSFFNELVAAARDVKIAKAQNPRTVQTIEQRQVESRSQTGSVAQPAANAKPAPFSSFVAKVPGGKVTVAVVGLVIGAVIIKRVL